MTDEQFKQAERLQCAMGRIRDNLAQLPVAEELTCVPTHVSTATRRRMREVIVEDLQAQLADMQRQWEAL